MFGSAKDFEPIFEEMAKVLRSAVTYSIIRIDFL
jgi:hypothetical protein